MAIKRFMESSLASSEVFKGINENGRGKKGNRASCKSY